jgi:hypothetical protein
VKPACFANTTAPFGGAGKPGTDVPVEAEPDEDAVVVVAVVALPAVAGVDELVEITGGRPRSSVRSSTTATAAATTAATAAPSRAYAPADRSG